MKYTKAMYKNTHNILTTFHRNSVSTGYMNNDIYCYTYYVYNVYTVYNLLLSHNKIPNVTEIYSTKDIKHCKPRNICYAFNFMFFL